MIYDLFARREQDGQLFVRLHFGDDDKWVNVNDMTFRVVAAYVVGTYNTTMKHVTNTLHVIVEEPEKPIVDDQGST